MGKMNGTWIKHRHSKSKKEISHLFLAAAVCVWMLSGCLGLPSETQKAGEGKKRREIQIRDMGKGNQKKRREIRIRDMGKGNQKKRRETGRKAQAWCQRLQKQTGLTIFMD